MSKNIEGMNEEQVKGVEKELQEHAMWRVKILASIEGEVFYSEATTRTDKEIKHTLYTYESETAAAKQMPSVHRYRPLAMWRFEPLPKFDIGEKQRA